MERPGSTGNRYGDNDTRPFFLNAEHYLKAHQILEDFANAETQSSDNISPQADDSRSGERVPALRIAEENRLLPVDGYFSFYSDLLGFTQEVSNGGMDSLPDYYGGAIVAASKNSNVSVYLMSDSCFATSSAEAADEFIRFVATIVSLWLSNGLIPQCSIGYGTFVERRPFLDKQPPNFLGTQISGTALSDAARLLKDNKPLGSRVLLSPTAWRHWPTHHKGLVVPDGQGGEFLLRRPLGHCLFDCVYYLLCLRDHEPNTRTFDHYVWSIASRALAGRGAVAQVAVRLAAPFCAGDCHKVAFRRINEVLATYRSAAPSS